MQTTSFGVAQKTIMKERPISFSEQLLHKVNSGSKTETRRLRGLNKINEYPNSHALTEITTDFHKRETVAVFVDKDTLKTIKIKCPYGFAQNSEHYLQGDHLWVRETFCNYHDVPIYKSDNSIVDGDTWKWLPPFLMSKKFSRTKLMITDIDCERLQDITESDAIAEGFNCIGELNAYQVFEANWDLFTKNYSWTMNPWVWVVRFKIIK